MNTCTCCFNDFIVKCNEFIIVNAQVQPNTEYTWVITDKFDRQYSGVFTSDPNGFWQIPIADLPEGLLTEFSGDFTLQVFSGNDACAAENFKIAQMTNCINFTVRNGTREKNNLGCEF